MSDKRIVTPEDLGDGIVWNDATQKYEASLLFTDREVEANIPFNGIAFMFRQLKNANRLMVCTGIKLDGVWYGDAPDNYPFQNPFTGQLTSQEPAPVAQPAQTEQA